MPVTTTWSNPAAAGALDLATGAVLTEAWTDAVASNFNYLGSTTGRICQIAATTVGSGTFTTTSTSLVDVTNATLTLTTRASPILAMFVGPAHSTVAVGKFQFSLDAVDVANVLSATPIGGPTNMATSVMYYWAAATAASHTIKLRAQVNAGGTLTMDFTQANGLLVVMEVR